MPNIPTIIMLIYMYSIMKTIILNVYFQPLGASDYLVISKTFHTVFVRNLPQLSLVTHRSQLRRFITMIDTLYDNKVRVCTGLILTLFLVHSILHKAIFNYVMFNKTIDLFSVVSFSFALMLNYDAVRIIYCMVIQKYNHIMNYNYKL